MWKILAGLDIAFSSLAVVSAGVLGNSLLAENVPKLHDNATGLSRLVMTTLTAPEALADEALGALPTVFVLALFALFFVAELALIFLTPLAERMVAFAAAQHDQRDVRFTYDDIRKNRGAVRALRSHLLRRVSRRQSALSLLAFTVGFLASAIAWGAALLINANTGGVVQTIGIVVGIVVLLFTFWVLAEVLPTATEDGGLELPTDDSPHSRSGRTLIYVALLVVVSLAALRLVLGKHNPRTNDVLPNAAPKAAPNTEPASAPEITPEATKEVSSPPASVSTPSEPGLVEEIELALPDESAPRFGLFSWQSQPCLSLGGPQVESGTLVYLATLGTKPQILKSAILQQLPDGCGEGLPPEDKGYLLSAASTDFSGEAVGIVGLSSPPRLAIIDAKKVQGLPTVLKLRYCYSSEGMHFTAWKTGARVWHAYRNFPYYTPASCTPADYAD